MKALIVDNQVVDVQEAEFEVHESMVWVDCDETVEVSDSYDNGVFTHNGPTQEEIQAKQANEEAKRLSQASGNQKLLDLGLTQAEATALTGYRPPSE
jgi:hypothetical protein